MQNDYYFPENIPDSLYAQLKVAASTNHRSLNSEILYCLKRAYGAHEINVSEHIEIARRLRAKKAHHSLTEQELTNAKNERRK